MPLASHRFVLADRRQPGRALIKEILRAAGGKQFVEVGEREAILAAVRKHKPDCIILDQDSGPLNGIAIVRALRALDEDDLRRIPVVLVAAGATAELVRQARNGGADEFLCKPLSAQKLLQRVDAALFHRREFICVPSYVGPCRRRFVDPHFEGRERRDLEEDASFVTAMGMPKFPRFDLSGGEQDG